MFSTRKNPFIYVKFITEAYYNNIIYLFRNKGIKVTSIYLKIIKGKYTS